ncbi:MAG: hypothetical protein IH965_06295 [Gemmatimonadetes bacterium]|nr:hypothetical protein [Gemmatimonadota bacterium]
MSGPELIEPVDSHHVNRRIIGSLHGRRKAHLRRDAKTGRSTLTARGREIAEQYLFAERLSTAGGAKGAYRVSGVSVTMN